MAAPPALVPPGTRIAWAVATSGPPPDPLTRSAYAAAPATRTADTSRSGQRYDTAFGRSRSMRREASSDLRSDMQPLTLVRGRAALNSAARLWARPAPILPQPALRPGHHDAEGHRLVAL